MAFRLPRRLHLGRMQSFGRRGNVVALAGLGALLISSAHAQVIIGGHGGPSVSVDNSVLDRLGPPITLPQFFLGQRDPSALNRHVATNQRSTHSAAPSHRTTRAKRHVATRHVAHRKTKIAKATPSRAAKAPVKTASSLNQIIHLIPPKSRLASASPAPSSQQPAGQQPTAQPAITHQDTAAISAPTKPTVVVLAASAAPTPAPKQPANSDIPTPPVVPPQQAREDAPPAPVAPPSQPVVATAPPAAPAPTVTASTVSTPAVMPIAASSPMMKSGATPAVSFSTVSVVSPGPTMTVTPATPPVQMAAATTVGTAASVLKFKAGATDLGNGPQPVLDTIANRLLAHETLRVQIVSHATGGADDAMEARRVSLARAVAVRAYLIEKGVRSLRIDVRALGNRADTGPVADQVDLLVVSQ
jgi:outer membrane protein OmpA-like peptidoglycan-associated protein